MRVPSGDQEGAQSWPSPPPPTTINQHIVVTKMPNEHMTTPATVIRLLGLDFTRAKMPSISPATDAEELIANIATNPDGGMGSPKGINTKRKGTKDIIPRISTAIPILLLPQLVSLIVNG